MSGHLSPEKVTGNPIRNERGNTTRTLLLVLLLVVAAAGYLYYFTDLIRPAKEEAKPPATQPVQVKQPIPPRPEQQGGQAATPAKPEEAKPPQGAPAPPPAKPAAEQKPAPAAAPAAKPEPAKVAKAEAPAKPAPPKQAAPAAAATAPAKPAAAAAASEKKVTAPAKTAAKAEKPAVKRKGGAYTLLIGDFVSDPTFATVQAKLKKSGVTPVRKSAVTAPETMSRLFVAEFNDQDAAEAELQKLKKLTADAFLIADNGKYSLYAGSYFTEGKLSSEMQRLGAKGVKTAVRKTQATIKVTRVTAGSYGSPEEARKDMQRLKKIGITAKSVKAGK